MLHNASEVSQCIPMNTTIKVKYVNTPKVPNGPGSIKTPEGVLYKVWPPCNGKPGIELSEFREGGTYEVEYQEGEYQGKPQRTAVKILGNGNGTNGHSNGAAASPVSSNSYSTGAPDRSARIERQHSQEMALRYSTLLGIDVADKAAALKPLIDWFQVDLENATIIAAAAAEAIALADGAEGNGSGEEGGF